MSWKVKDRSFTSAWRWVRGGGPLLAVALHDGHEVRAPLQARLAVADAIRRREEDPFTGQWTRVAPNRLIVRRSRFEFDLNRPREAAVYQSPADAWGIEVWRESLDGVVLDASLALYDAFYEETRCFIEPWVERHQRAVVFDIHSYNHRRAGPGLPPADPIGAPEINVGTGTMDRDFWAPVVERFLTDLREADRGGRPLDARENVNFRGGHFAHWIHSHWPRQVCVLSIEVKKFYMDEWTGRPDPRQVDAVEDALRSTVWGVYETLFQLRGRVEPGAT